MQGYGTSGSAPEAASIRVSVTCETQPGDTLCLSGEDASLGAWDTSKAIRFATDASSYPAWSAEIPVPAGGEFKFLVLKSSGDVAWEALDTARSWPSTGLNVGALLQTKFGEKKISIEASTAQLEAQGRLYKDKEMRKGSALQANLDRKGDSAYYHAHNRKFEVPEDAKVRTGEGLVTGGPPVLLEVGAETAAEEERTMWLKDYAWSDSGAKVKVYVPIAEGILPEDGADGLVQATYSATNIDLMLLVRPKQRLKIEKLNAEIIPESCVTRVEAKKSRIVLQLAKKKVDTTWYNLTKSK